MDELNKIIGNNLKKLRNDNNLTLDAVQELTGVSKGMLSQIERGETNPTMSTIWKIANGLKVPFGSFIKNEEEKVQIKHCFKIAPSISEKNFKVYSIYDFNETESFETFISEILPGGEIKSEPHKEGTFEYVLVLSGRLELKIGNESYDLAEGDYIRFGADNYHEYRNTGDITLRYHTVLQYT